MVSLIFLERSLVFPILLLSSISFHWSLRKAFLSLLAILWNSAFKRVYLSFSPLSFTSLLFTAICKASSDYHFGFLHFFFLGIVLIPASCTISRTSIHSSSGSLSIRSNPLNLFLTSLSFLFFGHWDWHIYAIMYKIANENLLCSPGKLVLCGDGKKIQNRCDIYIYICVCVCVCVCVCGVCVADCIYCTAEINIVKQIYSNKN